MEKELAIGIDLGGTKLSAAIVDEQGNTRDFIIQSSQFDKGLEAVFRGVIDVIQRLKQPPRGKVVAIGIAATGSIDPRTGTIIGMIPLCEGYIGFPLRKKVEQAINLPVVVENDANAAAYAEYQIGAGKNASRLVCITIGTGIGGGIIIEGQLLRGTGNAGEIGHMVVVKDGRRCACGKRGCLETYVSRKILEKDINRALKRGKLSLRRKLHKLTTEEIIKLIKSREPIVLEIVERQLEYLAIGVENLINLIDPDRILISGQFAELGEMLIKGLVARVTKSVQIEIAKLGNKAGLIGAGLIALEQHTQRSKNA
ncbi:MAG: ROK family protein [Candidatus Sumerlaeia bacterium]|nr:ROK family protein [Candidatus Sumerlaeia bacterium]